MTAMPDSIRDDATALNIALLDGLFDPPRRPLSVAEGMVQANPAAAIMLLGHIESAEELVGNRLALRAQDVLRAMIARQEARRVLDEIEADEIENHECEKMVEAMLNVLRPVVARQVARGVLDEIEVENNEDAQ